MLIIGQKPDKNDKLLQASQTNNINKNYWDEREVIVA